MNKAEKLSCCSINSTKKGENNLKDCCCHKEKSNFSKEYSNSDINQNPLNQKFINPEKQNCCVSVYTYFNFPVYKNTSIEKSTFSVVNELFFSKLKIVIPFDNNKVATYPQFDWDVSRSGRELNTQYCLLLI